MYTINARNVNEALALGINLFKMAPESLIHTAPRGMETLEYCTPVTTVYQRPLERVLFSPERDANPFFHFFESLWILAGRNDVKFLAYLLPRMAEYSDDGETFHAPYGYRLRRLYGIDQLADVAKMLRAEPDTRRAVCSIWDLEDDFNIKSKDIPCNDLLAFRVRQGQLDLTVYNRSNDMVWGAYGANAVQFSFILEYVAAAAGLPVGQYYQVSNSFHVYLNEQWEKLKHVSLLNLDPYAAEDFPSPWPIEPFPLLKVGATINEFEQDLTMFFNAWDNGKDFTDYWTKCHTAFFRQVALPMWAVFRLYRDGKNTGELSIRAAETIQARDWGLACAMWMLRRRGPK